MVGCRMGGWDRRQWQRRSVGGRNIVERCLRAGGGEEKEWKMEMTVGRKKEGKETKKEETTK